MLVIECYLWADPYRNAMLMQQEVNATHTMSNRTLHPSKGGPNILGTTDSFFLPRVQLPSPGLQFLNGVIFVHRQVSSQLQRRTTIVPSVLLLTQNPESQHHLTYSDEDGNNNQDNDDPRDVTHLGVGDVIGQDLGKVEEDATSFVENLGTTIDLEVFPDSVIERFERGFRVPEETWYVENVGCYRTCKLYGQWKGQGRGRHTEIDIHPGLEQPSQDLDDFRPRHTQLARQRQPFRHMLRIQHRLTHPLLEET